MTQLFSGSNPATATSALVVEGGAMRGIFAAGALDAFMQAGVYPFDFALGVSAGATNLTAYATRQPGRNRDVITRFARSRGFFSPLRFMRGGHLTDVDWLWNYAHDQLPLHTRQLSKTLPIYAVTTRVSDGKPCYLRVTANNIHAVMVATCALPFVFRKAIVVDGERYVDGGVADSIPVRKAWEMGARDITVVLSRPLGYRKKEKANDDDDSLMQKALEKMFGNDAALLAAMQQRSADYNASLDFIHNPPAGCRIRVIAPPDDFPVSRLTMNLGKIERGYEQGKSAGQAWLNQHFATTAESGQVA